MYVSVCINQQNELEAVAVALCFFVYFTDLERLRTAMERLAETKRGNH